MTREKPLESKPKRQPITGQWFVRLDGVYYGVARNRLSEDDDIVSRAYRILKEDGTLYDVAQTVYGNICDCPDFIFHRRDDPGNPCKHIMALEDIGIL